MYQKIIPIFNGCFTVNSSRSSSFPLIKDIHSFVFLIVDENNDAVLVDTGFSPDYIPGANTAYHQDTDQTIETALNTLGFSCSQISTVVMTHMHWDHTGAMQLFPHADFYIQADEFQALLQLNPNEETYYCPMHWISLLPKIHLLTGDYELKPGLKLLYTGGHTAGHQAVLVNTGKSSIVLAGDIPFNYDQLWKSIPQKHWDSFRKGPGKHCYWETNILATIKNWLLSQGIVDFSGNTPRSVSEVKQEADKFITSHDPRLLTIESLI